MIEETLTLKTHAKFQNPAGVKQVAVDHDPKRAVGVALTVHHPTRAEEVLRATGQR